MAIHVQINISADESGQLSETERSVLAALGGSREYVAVNAESVADVAKAAEVAAEEMKAGKLDVTPVTRVAEDPAPAPKKAPAKKAPAKKAEPKEEPKEEPKTLQEELAEEPEAAVSEPEETPDVPEEPEAAEEPETAEEDAGEATLQDAVDLATKLMSSGKAADVKAVLTDAGVKRVSELKGAAISKFVNALKGL